MLESVTVADADAGSGQLQVALSVSHGTLTLASQTGISIAAGANNSGAVTIQGTLGNLNNALNGLRYVSTANYTGPDSLAIVTNDQGNTGTGGARTDSDAVAITVTGNVSAGLTANYVASTGALTVTDATGVVNNLTVSTVTVSNTLFLQLSDTTGGISATGDVGTGVGKLEVVTSGQTVRVRVSDVKTTANINLGGGNDTVALNTGALTTATDIRVAGGNGTDTLVGDNTGRTYFISGTGSGSITGILPFGFNGIENVTGGSGNDEFRFANFATLGGQLNGGAGSDTLVGDNGNRTWFVTGANVGSTTGMAPFGFQSIENLVGGGANDEFRFADFATLNGTLNGGTGSDALYGDNGNRSWYVAGTNVGSTTGMVPFGFQNVETLVGGGGADEFRFLDFATLTGPIFGGGGTDTLVGDNGNRSWFVSGVSQGSTTGMVPFGFTSVENLTGGGGNDEFRFANFATLNGQINGGPGSDTLFGDNGNRSWYIAGTNVGSTTGMVPFGFQSVENLVGGGANDDFVFAGGTITGTITGGFGNDSITGDNASRFFAVSGPNIGSIVALLPSGFSSVEAIFGGAGNDTISFGPSGSLSGGFNLGGGSNTVLGGASSARRVGTAATDAVDLLLSDPAEWWGTV